MGMIARIGLAALCVGLSGTAWAATPQAWVHERDEVARSGLATIAEFLARQPWAGSGQSPRLNGGGLGTETIDVGELGELRTEVVVDGRRWIADLEGGFDLGAIPLSSVERIVVTRGGRGVGGTIDITLRAPVDGVEARSGFGEFTAGDGRRESHGVRIGATGERGAAQLEASYLKQDGLRAGDRAVSSVITPGFDPDDVRAGASSTTPFGRFRLSGPGAPFPPDRVLIPARPGTSPADFRGYDARTDGYNFVADENLLAPSELTSLRASGNTALFDGVTARVSVLASERRSEQRFGGQPLLVGALAPDPVLRTVNLSASAFNPFRLPATAQFRPIDFDRVFAQDTDTVVFDAGLEGGFELFDHAWRWHAGWRDADRERAETTTGFFDNTRLALGLGASFRDADGTVRCGTPQAPIAGCVPINLFGGPAGFTAAMREFAGAVLQSTLDLSQTQYVAGLDGVLAELPAGALALALDVEHRRESGRYTPDALVAARGTDASGAFGNLPYDGRIVSDRVDLGFDVPLLRDGRFARALDLSLGAEWLDDDDTGSETSPRVALRWAPVEAVRFDAGWTRQARAPSLLERFEAATESFVPFADPCSIPLLATRAAEVQQRCRSGFGGLPGVPVGYGQTDLTAATFGGGLADGLVAERAIQRRLAVSFAPASWPGAQASLGWNRTRIDDAIGIGDVQRAVDACYLAGNTGACRRLSRQSASGEITRIFAGWSNRPVGLEVESWDLGLADTRDTSIGRFGARLDASYVSYLGEAGQPDRGDLLADGSLAQGNVAGVFRGDLAIAPRLRTRIAVDWTRGDWSATLGYDWRSSLVEDCGVVTGTARAVGDPARAATLCSDPAGTPRFPNGANRIASHGTADLSVRWETPWDGQVALGIHNLFDHDPPTSYASGNGNLLVIDPLPGRAWWASVAQRW
jgi:iron complex outermembrane receptor protein